MPALRAGLRGPARHDRLRPATNTREGPKERAFDYARTVALSDGVFAIALTLLVLSISAPMLASGDHDELGRRLVDREPEFRSYAISFAVIGFLWVRHHRFFRGLAWIDTETTVLNLTYLGFVAFLPYPTRIIGLYGDQPLAVGLYAGTLAAVAVLTGLMRRHAIRAELISDDDARELGGEHWAVGAALFLLSIPVAFLSTIVAELLWAPVFLLPVVLRRTASGRV